MTRQDDHQKYRDQLRYQKLALDTNEFLRILFDFGYRELEEGLNCTPQGIKKQTEAAEKAKKAAGLWLGREPQLNPDIRAKVDFSSDIREKFYTDKDFKSKIEAYSYFKEWVAIKFPPLYFGPYSKRFPPKPFFRWIVDDSILKKLEELKVPTTIRAKRLAEFVVDEKLEPLIQETSNPEPTPPEPESPNHTDNRRGPKEKEDWNNLLNVAVQTWEKSERKMKPEEIYNHPDVQKVIKNHGEKSKKHIKDTISKRLRAIKPENTKAIKLPKPGAEPCVLLRIRKRQRQKTNKYLPFGQKIYKISARNGKPTFPKEFIDLTEGKELSR